VQHRSPQHAPADVPPREYAPPFGAFASAEKVTPADKSPPPKERDPPPEPVTHLILDRINGDFVPVSDKDLVSKQGTNKEQMMGQADEGSPGGGSHVTGASAKMKKSGFPGSCGILISKRGGKEMFQVDQVLFDSSQRQYLYFSY
jgi:hypothetical protein